jgi:hypothetical protein
VKDFETFYDLICFFLSFLFGSFLSFLSSVYFLFPNLQFSNLFSFLVHPFLASYVFLSTFSLRQNHLFFYSNLLSLF